MKKIKSISLLLLVSVVMISISGCAPEVGSEAWCKQMKEKDAADMSTNEGLDYAKHCLMK